MYKYVVYWMLMKLIPSSDPAPPRADAFGNQPAVVTCKSISFTLGETFYYQSFSTRDSALSFKATADSTINVKRAWVDSMLINK